MLTNSCFDEEKLVLADEKICYMGARIFPFFTIALGLYTPYLNQ